MPKQRPEHASAPNGPRPWHYASFGPRAASAGLQPAVEVPLFSSPALSPKSSCRRGVNADGFGVAGALLLVVTRNLIRDGLQCVTH